MKRLSKKCLWLTLAFFLILMIGGCGEPAKQPPQPPQEPKQEAPKPQVKESAPSGSPAAKLSCYEIGYRTGRCVAKSMSNLPCDPSEEIPMPPECKGKADTEKGLTEGRKSVY